MHLLLLLAFAPVTPALAATDWNAILNQSGGTKVFFGVSLEGPEPFDRNAGKNFAPASNSKIFTASTALALLGKDYRYVTRLEWQQDGTQASHITLVGSGDPTWGMIQFGESLTTRVDDIAQKLRESGVESYAGDLTVKANDSRWDEIEIPAGWTTQDPEGCGGALAESFTLDINCATLKISSATNYSWLSPGISTRVRMNLTPGPRTSIKANFTRFEDGAVGYTVTGSWKNGPQTFVLPVWQTRGWIQNLLRAALEKKGIPEAAARPFPTTTHALTFLSPPLKEIIKPFLKNSINIMGDAILKTLAVEMHRPEESLLAGGIAVIREQLLRNGVPDEFELRDGAGLSRTSFITPRAMLATLTFIQSAEYFPEFWEALPIAGMDGTLRNRMKGTAAAGRLRAKTGTLNGVYNLAGFVPERGGYVPFVMLTNTSVSQSTVARGAQDRVGVKLSAIVDRSGPRLKNSPYPYYFPNEAGMDDQ